MLARLFISDILRLSLREALHHFSKRQHMLYPVTELFAYFLDKKKAEEGLQIAC